MLQVYTRICNGLAKCTRVESKEYAFERWNNDVLLSSLLPAWKVNYQINISIFFAFVYVIVTFKTACFRDILLCVEKADYRIAYIMRSRVETSLNLVVVYYLFLSTIISYLSLIHIWRCRRSTLCRSRWSPYH